MKREFEKGNFIHVYNRGNKKMPIIHDEHDKWRFLKILRFFNDELLREHFFRGLSKLQMSDIANPAKLAVSDIASLGISKYGYHFNWPKAWPPRKPLVKILSYCLKKNHFHLILKEIIDGGTSKFMKKLSIGFTNFSNTKYNEVGSVFQGTYKAKIVGADIGGDEDIRDLYYLDAYVQVFNAIEDCPGGIEKSLKEFDKAFECALNNPFCSLGETFGRRNLQIIDRDVLKDKFPNIKAYKEFAYDCLVRRHIQAILGKMTLEIEE